MNRFLLPLALAWCLLAGALPAAAAVPHFDHIVVIMLENHGDASIIGNPAAPRLTRLAEQNGYAARYFGVTHPSLPNYVAITSGNTWYSNSDNPTQRFNHVNLVDELEAHHISWKAYMQSIPHAGFTGNYSAGGDRSALYVIRHDPFMLYDDVRDSAARRAHVVPITQLSADLRAGRLPSFTWISPDVCNDMHGMSGKACPYAHDTQTKERSDAYVARLVRDIRSSKSWTKHSVIFIMTDETDFDSSKEATTGGWASATGCCDSPIVPKNAPFFPHGGMYGGGPAPLIVISPIGKRHYISTHPYNHYSVLSTIEQSWNLPLLGMTSDTLNVQPLDEFFH